MEWIWLALGAIGALVAVWLISSIAALKRRAAQRTLPGSPERLSRLNVMMLADREGLAYFLGNLTNTELGDFSGTLRGIAVGLERNGIDIRPQLYRQFEERGLAFPHRARAELSEMDAGELRELIALIETL